MSAYPDRLYQLLPAVYRQRDKALGEPLRSHLQVIAEQVDIVEADIDQLYQNWFIETCEDWVVPYIADLIGYRPVAAAGRPSDLDTPQGQARNRILIPRREIANTIRYRRRKGTLALLELLAQDTAGWPARAVEFYKLLGITQSVNHLRLDRGKTVDVRQGQTLDRLTTPFSTLAHTVDIRSIASKHDPGRHHVPHVGLFVWRLNAYSVTQTPAYCLEEVGSNCYTFSVLGNDTPLYTKPVAEAEPTDIAGELNVPAPIRRRAFEQRVVEADGRQRVQASADYYGEGKSVAIWAADWPSGSKATKTAAEQTGSAQELSLIPADKIIPADLSNWQYRPRPGFVAVDPELGRIVFPPSQLPRQGVVVSYHYGFSADVGGGEYDRSLIPVVDNPLLRPSDFKDASRFILRLKQSSALTDYLRSQLSASTRSQLDAQDVTEDVTDAVIGALLKALARELNDVLATARLYEDNRFDSAALPRHLRDLILQEPTGEDLIRLNRMLLELAFDDSLAATHKVYPVRQRFPGSNGLEPRLSTARSSAATPAEPLPLMPFTSLTDAIAQWQQDQPRQAVIEILDSDVYVEQINLEVGKNQTLQIRAANHQRPVLRLLNWYTALPDALCVTLHPGSHFILDGLLITGRGLWVRQSTSLSEAPSKPASQPASQPPNTEQYGQAGQEKLSKGLSKVPSPSTTPPPEPRSHISTPKAHAYFTVRHSTLVPGWSLDNNCDPSRPAEPSLELSNFHGTVTIDHSIVGSLQVNQDEVQTEPVSIHIQDSVLDAINSHLEAIGAPGYPVAHAILRVIRSTVFGRVQAHAIALAENSIFEGKITVARSQIGCMRFCAYIKGSRTPRRFRCQPDLAIATVEQQLTAAGEPLTSEIADAARMRERSRVQPRFNSTRYGTPTYCQLAAYCPVEIRQGADDESEMGVFHHLYQPQRAANLQARLDEYTPAGTTAAILYAS